MSTTDRMRVVVAGQDKCVKIEQYSVPQPGPDEVLLKIVAVGLNPTDYKHVDYGLAKPGDLLGCDFVGEVVHVGKNVPQDQVKNGELRWSFTRGGQGKRGAFAEYITADWDLTSLVPPNVTAQQAATLPIPLMTAVQALYLPSCLGLPEPPAPRPTDSWILIWSGATSVGCYTIQLAKLSGLKVAVTASKRRWNQLKSYGADVLVDYKDADVVDRLKEATGNSIQYGLDCVTTNDSIIKAQMAFRPQGGKLITTLFDFPELPRPEVKTEPTLVYTTLGENHKWGNHEFKTDPSHRALYVRWTKKITQLLADGKLKPLEVDVMGGIEDIPKGLDILREGKNDKKMVYNIPGSSAGPI